jgi:hypothetical protein
MFYETSMGRSIADVPGFEYRWMIKDSDSNSYLMVNFTGESLRNYKSAHDSVAGLIGLKTRALLKSRGVTSAEVHCRANIPRIKGTKLFTLPVTFTF